MAAALTPCLWFDNNGEEAIRFYESVFPDTKLIEANDMGDGEVLVMDFNLLGQRYMAFNGGPMFQFSEAISLAVHCDTQEEVDGYWDVLTANGGEESMCGWLKDRFGLSWQIIPKDIGKYLGGPDAEGASRAMAAMMKMHKLEINVLREAYEGVSV